MITLCLNSFEIASKMPNFSSWVREKILEEGSELRGGTIFRYKCRICKKTTDFGTQEMVWQCNMCNIEMFLLEIVE